MHHIGTDVSVGVQAHLRKYHMACRLSGFLCDRQHTAKQAQCAKVSVVAWDS